MGIKLSEQHKRELKQKLRELLAKENITLEQTINYYYVSILESFEADSRWLRISQNDLEILSKRFDKKIPNTDFRIKFGSILVQRFGNTIRREWYSENTVVKGWHRSAIGIIRERHRVRIPDGMVGAIFQLGQEFIKKHGS